MTLETLQNKAFSEAGELHLNRDETQQLFDWITDLQRLLILSRTTNFANEQEHKREVSTLYHILRRCDTSDYRM